ncbi:hypothetical protein RHMOL_Rhmol06G0225300 [Rhododendron molle]|uniref:Uncharacterized protein n=1 Tax=Rhododendron molle TaxID=49168 RepID=A0ACC0NGQ6_RHOML|nr:hypothetical protein RHMOL_Rhmol06G0225300 [Rhododendron molle]
MAKVLELRGAQIESDNQMAIKFSVSELDPPWSVMAVVFDIRRIYQEEEFSCAWINREANELAHVVASEALRGVLPANWVSSPSVGVLSILDRNASLSL